MLERMSAVDVAQQEEIKEESRGFPLISVELYSLAEQREFLEKYLPTEMFQRYLEVDSKKREECQTCEEEIRHFLKKQIYHYHFGYDNAEILALMAGIVEISEGGEVRYNSLGSAKNRIDLRPPSSIG